MQAAKSWAIAAGFFVALYALSFSYDLNYFYLRGGAVYDAGWFSWLANNAVSWPMLNPHFIGGNFLAIHASFIFFLTTLILHPVLSIPEVVRFSLLFSLWVPLFWLSIFLIVRRYWLATLFTFNGLNLAMLGFPHIESFIVPFGLLSLAVFFRVRGAVGFMLALVPLGLALSIREDAGFHIFIWITALLACQFASKGTLDRGLIGLALIALIGSVGSLLLQKFMVPGGGGQINQIYFGHPLFAGLTVHSLLHRLVYWSTRRTYIFLPLAIMAFIAIRRWANSKFLLVGIGVALPWLTLSLIAVASSAGNLMDYYCFPLLFAFFWPLFLAEVLNLPALLNIQFAMGAASTLMFIFFGVLPFVGDGGLHDRAPWTHLVPPRPSLITATQAAIANNPNSIFDDGAASLIVGDLRSGQFALNDTFTLAQLSAARTYIRFVTPPAAYIADQAHVLDKIFSACNVIPSTRLEVCQRTSR
ncbi:MAG TPA: hypothetical protein PLI96_12025 [Halothiobacillus sp.]|nr:MAG: hypothetical protein B7Z75_08180 [Acidocella sp. 20-57-95]HUN01193.1 hypothetical protein [Halothiobacillus sp.]